MVSSNRPRTPGGGASPPSDKLASIPEGSSKQSQPRRSSLGLLLRRTKSSDLGSKGSKKHQAREAELARQREAAAASRNLPSLPILYNGAALRLCRPLVVRIKQCLAGSAARIKAVALWNLVALRQLEAYQSPMPGADGRKVHVVDPYARTESMTNRGRYSYASSAVSTINSPRRVRRRKDPTPFNILIIGARSAGKTSFLNFLKTALALSPKKRSTRGTSEGIEDVLSQPSTNTGNFIAHYLETEIDNERIGLTLWDSEGLDKSVVDLQLREMSSFLESKFEETFTEEMKVVRAPGVQDTHIHCAFLVLDPVRLDRNIATGKTRTTNGQNGVNGNGKYSSGPRLIGGLDEDLDLNVLRTLQGKTTVVPVISKADTITTAHMTYLKKTVSDGLRKANLDPLEALGFDDVEGEVLSNVNHLEEGDEDEQGSDSGSGQNAPNNLPIQSNDVNSSPQSHFKRQSTGSLRQHKRQMSNDDIAAAEETPYLPLSIISPDIYEPGVIGRKFPWGFADPYNVEHCDFVRLKEAVFSEWRGELREASRELWYEGWRTSRLKHREVKGKR